jgi:Tol biopolymer transport system component
MRNWTVHRRGALAALLLIIAAFGCGGDKSPTGPGGNGDPKPTSISLSKGTHAFTALGDSTRLTATVKDQAGAAMADANVTWASTDTAVAKVNASGWVFAARVGTAKVVATSGALADTAAVQVAQVPARVEVSPDSVGVDPGNTVLLGAAVRDANGKEIEGAAVTWASVDTAVAVVDSTGLVTGVATGTTRVVARAGEAADTVAVVVAPGAGGEPGDGPAPAVVEVTPALLQFEALGDSIRVSAVVRDAEAAEIAGAAVTWSSTDPAVARVSASGWVVAVANGTASVLATAGEVADTVAVQIQQVPVTLVVAPDSVKVGEGKTVQLEAKVFDANDVPIAGAAVTWSSAGTLIATVDAKGLVTGKAYGTKTTVTAKAGALSKSVPVRVLDQILFRATDGSISLVNEDGSDEKALFTGADLLKGNRPSWSPDGKKIAFKRLSIVGSHILVMNPDGSGQTAITTDGWSDWPVWSPDGTKIAFAKSSAIDNSTPTAVHVMNADGTGQTKLSASVLPEFDPVWSPDGKMIAFLRDYGASGVEIVVMNSNGIGPEARLTSNTFTDTAVVWSADSKKIAYQSNRSGQWRVYLTDIGTKATAELTVIPPVSSDRRLPAWSPDGEQIAYVSNQYSGSTEIVLQGVASAVQRRFTFHNGTALYPKWSADNSRILYYRAGTGGGLYMKHLDHGDGTLVTSSTSLLGEHAWRPRPMIIIVPPIFP